METTNTGLPPGTERRHDAEPSAAGKRAEGQPLRASRPVPFLRLILFYVVVVGIASALIYFLPLVQHAWVSEPAVGNGSAFPTLNRTEVASAWQDRGMLERTVSVFLISIGALTLALPVAWVYTFTRRLRYDPSLVHSVIILPMVVAGIVVIVKDSVALAFSLAGIVAVVRFRNTLKDPKDAVYIFLALGLGLAAGVQALDIAMVLSVMFNFVVLILWKYNLASIYGESQRDILSVGDRNLMIARTGPQRDSVRWRLAREATDMDTDGILIVHAPNREAAKQRVELAVAKVADDWRISNNFRTRNGMETFAVMLQLKDKKGDPLTLLSEIDEQWSQDIPAAEFVPFRRPAEEKKKKSGEAKETKPESVEENEGKLESTEEKKTEG